MKKVSLFHKFSGKETVPAAQAAKLKGGDDKRPPIKLPDSGPQPNGNYQGQNNNIQ